MTRRAGVALLTGTVVVVLFAAVATGGEVKFADRAPSFPGSGATEEPVATTPPTQPAYDDSTRPSVVHVPHLVGVLVRAVLFALLAVLVALVVRNVWRHRPRLRWRFGRRRRASKFDVLDDVAAAVGADAEAQRAALRRGSPRNAIVECWLRLEKAVATAGVRHDPADTSTELTMRVLTSVHVDQDAIERLAVLYREARFSDHSMGEDARRAAIDALDAIHDGLREGRDAVGATA